MNYRINKIVAFLIGVLICSAAASSLLAVETGKYRLLSVSESSKMILISEYGTKTRYILDASTAKITLDGEPAEFKELTKFAVINVKFELKKLSKNGIDLNGVASEIVIKTPEQPKKAATAEAKQP